MNLFKYFCNIYIAKNEINIYNKFITREESMVYMINNVKKIRKDKKISQSELAKRTGITRQTISLIEVGKYNPSLKLCIELAEELDTDLNSLFWKVGETDVE